MARILIVDDSPSQLMGIRRIVEKLGHEALTAEDGAAGVEVGQARTAGPGPDGRGDAEPQRVPGHALDHAAIRPPQHIPVVLVTTKDQDTDRVWGMRQGAKAYITKPFSESDLADMIDAGDQAIAVEGMTARCRRLRRQSSRQPRPRRRPHARRQSSPNASRIVS